MISADRRIAEVGGACEVRYDKDGPLVPVRSEPGHVLHVVTDTFLTERYQLERQLRLRIEKLEADPVAPGETTKGAKP